MLLHCLLKKNQEAYENNSDALRFGIEIARLKQDDFGRVVLGRTTVKPTSLKSLKGRLRGEVTCPKDVNGFERNDVLKFVGSLRVYSHFSQLFLYPSEQKCLRSLAAKLIIKMKDTLELSVEKKFKLYTVINSDSWPRIHANFVESVFVEYSYFKL